MSNTIKFTKKDRFNQLLAIADVSSNPELVAFIDHEIELLENKANRKSDKPTKAQIENERLMADILDIMAENTQYTVTDLTKFLNREGITPNKVSAMMKKLVERGSVVREEIKRKALFTKVTE